MNQPIIPQAAPKLISPEAIQQAKQIAQQSRRRLIEVLADQSELSQEAFLAALGVAFQYVTLDNKALHEPDEPDDPDEPDEPDEPDDDSVVVPSLYIFT